jgi:hypothetical protein
MSSSTAIPYLNLTHLHSPVCAIHPFVNQSSTDFQKKHPFFRSNFSPTGVAFVLVASLLSHSPEDCFPSPITKEFIVSRMFRHLAAMMTQCEETNNSRHQHRTMSLLVNVLETLLQTIPPHSVALENQALRRISNTTEDEQPSDPSLGFQSVTKVCSLLAAMQFP